MDNMTASISIGPVLSQATNIEVFMSMGIESIGLLSQSTLMQPSLSGSAKMEPCISGLLGVNALNYDDPVDYLLMESGIILRTEDDKYIKLEGSV